MIFSSCRRMRLPSRESSRKYERLKSSRSTQDTLETVRALHLFLQLWTWSCRLLHLVNHLGQDRLLEVRPCDALGIYAYPREYFMLASGKRSAENRARRFQSSWEYRPQRRPFDPTENDQMCDIRFHGESNKARNRVFSGQDHNIRCSVEHQKDGLLPEKGRMWCTLGSIYRLYHGLSGVPKSSFVTDSVKAFVALQEHHPVAFGCSY